MLPEYSGLKNDLAILGDDVVLEQMPGFIDRLAIELRAALDSAVPGELSKLCGELLELLPESRSRTVRLIEDLKKIADQSSKLVDEMDFGFLLNPGRNLLSVAYEVGNENNHPACYDLLASEARIAYFVAIAKDDIPQDSWFQLGRPPMADQGTPGLLSWTGTMFEYLMPALWTHLYPNTLPNGRRKLLCAPNERMPPIRKSHGAFPSRPPVKWIHPATITISLLECLSWRSTNPSRTDRSSRPIRLS